MHMAKRNSVISQPGLQEDTHKNMQNESEAGNATRKSQKQRLTKKKIKTSRRLVGATATNPPKSTEKVLFRYICAYLHVHDDGI